MSSFISNFRLGAKKVLIDLLAFCALFFILDRACFMLVQLGESSFYRHFSPKSLNEKFSRVQSKGDYRFLILGTSRTYDAIHPFYIRKHLRVRAFKEAFVGKGPMYNYYFYREFKKAMGVPQVVLYGVDYFLYNVETERQWMQRFPQGVIQDVYHSRGISMLWANKTGIDRLLNNFINGMHLDAKRNRNLRFERDVLLMESYRGDNFREAIETREPAFFDKYFFFPYPGQEGAYFSRLMDELQRDGVTVLLVSLPEYIGTYRSNKSHRLFRRAFRYYQRKHANVRFLDYNRPSRFDLENPEYFIDGGFGKTNSHLSRRGAEIFNLMLIADLRRILNEDETGKRD
jgi:hypothetical protein